MTPAQRAQALWSPGHEFGHALGLADRYNTSGNGLPYYGNDDTLMGEAGAPLTAEELARVKAKANSAACGGSGP